MRVRYIYSACVVIDTPDVSILCDPWFTQGIYDGAWYQWPVIKDPLDIIGPADLIYISHIHPDHYDPIFLKAYLERYPTARIVIGPQSPPILEQKLRMDGLAFEVLEDRNIGATRLSILPNHARPVNIDTALVVVRDGQSVANLNDNPFDPRQIAAINVLCTGTEMLALLSYGGATAHPHTYMFDNRAGLEEAIRLKERHFLDLFHRFIAALNPRIVIPFAGKYWLGGPLATLNGDRGIPDPVIAAREADGRAVVLADGGRAVFDLDSMSASDVRAAPYDHMAVQRHLESLDFPGYAYEREIRPDPDHLLPLLPLLNAALRRAREKFKVDEPCWICIRPSGHDHFLYFDAAGIGDAQVWKKPGPPAHLSPRLEIYIDDRYLFGLFTRLYHWNNASLGSHYRFRRVPDVFRRDVFSFLDFLQV